MREEVACTPPLFAIGHILYLILKVESHVSICYRRYTSTAARSSTFYWRRASIEKQEYKSSNELIITAKKMMGYEIDIETIEFSTKLPGNYFISKKLYAFKKDSTYTIPLEPFFDIKFENVEIIKMGIFDNNNNGEYKYVY
jgi:hypothetical protein